MMQKVKRLEIITLSKMPLAFKRAWRKSWGWAFGAVSILFTLAPESLFEKIPFQLSPFLVNAFQLECLDATSKDVLFNRTLSLVGILIISFVCFAVRCLFKQSISLKGKNYIIQVEYGDVLRKKKCKRVINFDECFTTSVGDKPEDIKPTSLCGRYLTEHPDVKCKIKEFINSSGLTPEHHKSKCQGKERYKSGKMVQNGDDLLMAFAHLDKDGRGYFASLNDYIECLNTMWEELDKFYGQQDVCIPVLGSGITRIGNSGQTPKQQDLLDIIIWSYKLSTHKIKYPYKLIITCKEDKEFSLLQIDGLNK